MGGCLLALVQQGCTIYNLENNLPDVDMEPEFNLDQDNLPQKQAPRKGTLRAFLDILETVFLALALYLVIQGVSERIRIDGSSMEPNLHHGEFVIVSKLNYRFGSPERGDVVVFDFPRNITQEYIKRVIGLPGDQVQIKEGKIYINDALLSEPYLEAEPNYEGRWEVPENTYFVLGDNRNNSSDSHNWGMVPVENLVGEALLIYWPPSSWGLVNGVKPVLASDG
jgi:signal peptidase I